MQARQIITAVLLLFAAAAVIAIVAKSLGKAEVANQAGKKNQEPDVTYTTNAPEHQFIVTYFHNNVRCPSCLKIEKFSSECIKARFSDGIADGTFVFRTVNVDEPGNAHYIEDYSLYTKHLVISELEGGKEKRWLDLNRIWDLLGNEQEFKEYVTTSIQQFMDGGPAGQDGQA